MSRCPVLSVRSFATGSAVSELQHPEFCPNRGRNNCNPGLAGLGQCCMCHIEWHIVRRQHFATDAEYNIPAGVAVARNRAAAEDNRPAPGAVDNIPAAGKGNIGRSPARLHTPAQSNLWPRLWTLLPGA